MLPYSDHSNFVFELASSVRYFIYIFEGICIGNLLSLNLNTESIDTSSHSYSKFLYSLRHNVGFIIDNQYISCRASFFGLFTFTFPYKFPINGATSATANYQTRTSARMTMAVAHRSARTGPVTIAAPAKMGLCWALTDTTVKVRLICIIFFRDIICV